MPRSHCAHAELVHDFAVPLSISRLLAGPPLSFRQATAVAVSLLAADATPSDITATLRSRTAPGVRVQLAVQLAASYRADHIASVSSRIVQFLHAVHTHHWHGRPGATDAAVASAVGALAWRYSRLPVAAAGAEVAVAAGVQRTTAFRSLTRLCADGWLLRVRPGSRAHAALYDFGPLPDLLYPASSPHSTIDRLPPTVLHDDATRWGALGKSSARVLDKLNASPQRVAVLADALGCAPGTVRRHLTKLRRAALAEPTKSGWVRSPHANLTATAISFGTHGRASRQRQALQTRRLATTPHPGR